jgi:hypothetical protein
MDRLPSRLRACCIASVARKPIAYSHWCMVCMFACLLIDGDCAGVVLAEASFEVDSSSGASVHSGGDYTLDALVVRHVQAVAYVV